MKYFLSLIFVFLFNLTIASQTKSISGDTLYFQKNVYPIFNNLRLNDLKESENDFSFRFQRNGIIVDIKKNENGINGQVINYTYRIKPKQGIVYQKQFISDSLATRVYQAIMDSGILDIESDNNISDWQQGSDGSTYLFEYSDTSSYTVHKYWTPSAQKSLKEANQVNDFVSDIYSILDIDELSNDFKREYLKNGCYNDGSMVILCIDNENSYSVGYSGSGKLPVGYLASVRFNYWGGIFLNINHQFNRHREYDFSGGIAKSNLFIKSKGRNDFIRYIYRTRKLHEEVNIQNHNIMYGINIRSTGIALGSDFLRDSNTKAGGVFLIQQYFPVMKASLSAQTYVYKDLINYKFQASKLVRLNTHYLRYIYLNLYFENFVKQQNIGWSVSADF